MCDISPIADSGGYTFNGDKLRVPEQLIIAEVLARMLRIVEIRISY